MEQEKNLSLVDIQKEVSTELANKKTVELLLQTTFKGLSSTALPQAITEGMIRGYTFKDFLERNIYAIPFKEGYSLVTSIDHARKIGMRSGVIFSSEPEFELDEHDKPTSCKVTIKRRVGQDVAEFTAKVYFSEYYKAGKNGYPSLWDTKPRTMIAKVAEMHALRKACPENLSQAYVEEELAREQKLQPQADLEGAKAKLEAASSLDELGKAWADLPADAKQRLELFKDELKKTFAPTKIETPTSTGNEGA